MAQIFDLHTGYEISVYVISIMIAISGISLGIGYAFNEKRFKEFGKEELYQSVTDGENVEEQEATGKWLVMWYYGDLANIVAENFRSAVFFRTSSYYGTRKIIFVGKKVDVQVAKEVYDMMRKQLDRDIEVFETQLRNKGIRRFAPYRNDYSRGWLIGLKTKFRDQVAQFALVPVKPKEVNEYMDNMDLKILRNGVRDRMGDLETQARGYEDGKRAGSQYDRKGLE